MPPAAPRTGRFIPAAPTVGGHPSPGGPAEWLLVVLAVLVVVAATLYLRRRPGRVEPRDELPDSRLDRDRMDGPDARGAVNKNSWMLGGGGTGG